MTVVRVLGTVGKTIFALGLAILLFAVFQLWGTGIFEARAQQSLDSEFSDLLEESGTLEPTPGTPGAPAAQGAAGSAAASSPDAASRPPEADPTWLAMLYREPGSAIARIQIPAIGVDKTVVEGVRVSDLRRGPGRYPSTPLPGQAGNAAIAGHRTTYGAPFGNIDKLDPQDEIIVTTIQGQFTYRVVAQGQGHGHFIVAPHQVEVLSQNFRDHPNRLTLTACHPKGSASQRIIVVAELVGDPAPTYPRPQQLGQATVELASEGPAEGSPNQGSPAEGTTAEVSDTTQTVTPASASEPTDPSGAAAPVAEDPGDEEPGPIAASSFGAISFGEGLNGDSDGLAPAILWGLAALAIWFFALFTGKRWRRLPTYSLSALPFLAVLFIAFWHIDQVLPSY